MQDIAVIPDLSLFNHVNCLVIGDVMLDAYLWGKVNRISPEAPVPIFEVKQRENRLGGAANVAINLRSLGANVFLAAVVGMDSKGGILKELIKEYQIHDDALISVLNRPTTSKTRVMSGSHHLLRVDEEDCVDVESEVLELLVEKIELLIVGKQIKLIVLEDYNKGLLSEKLIKQIITLGKKHQCILTVDPKKHNFLVYKGVDLFKPNFKEFQEAVNPNLNKTNLTVVQSEVTRFCAQQGIKHFLLTLSEQGVFWLDEQQANAFHFPAHVRKIADVSGAGDTVIAVASLALACGFPIQDIAILANLAGGLVCEEVGVVPIQKEKLAVEFLKLKQR